ncbi:MAG: sulfatase-like hydrolase/transferase [Planctomycetota bacterium]
MKRFLALCTSLTLAVALNSVHAESSSTPAGVVLVLIDDIGYGDIDILYPSSLETPNIDALYKQSVRLTDFHVGTTCSPTRASLMTGRSVNAGGVWHTVAGRELLRENEQTMAEVFRANGWKTGVFGKWHLGEGFPFAPRFRGFDVTAIHGGGGVGQGPDYWKNDYYSGVDFDGAPTRPDFYFANGEPFKADQFCTDLWFARAQQFIQACVSEGEPFFCYLPTNAAHGPFNAPHGYKKGFDGLIENVDDNMGRLDEFLSSAGILDDVLLIFATDNGTTGSRLGGLREIKGSNYDGGHNVPCFWRWKNGGIGGALDSARDVPSLTAAMDLLPTFLDLFDFERPPGGSTLHGVSLKERLLDPDFTPQERTVVVDTQRAADFTKWKRACVMRDEVVDGRIVHKWRLIRASATSPFELYDFLVDRDTDDDLADGNDEKAASLSSAYEAWWNEISPGQEPYPPFVLDEAQEAELTLHSHSWIGDGTSPWHQGHVVRGSKGTRTHSIRFDKAGRYRFELRRWPREDGGPLAGKSSTGEGEAIPATKVGMRLASVGELVKDIPSGDSAIVFEVDVPAGEPTTLTTALLDEDANVLSGAYYVYVRRTDADDDSVTE